MRLAVAALLIAVFLLPGAVDAQGPGPTTSGAPFTFTVPQSRVVVKLTEPALLPDPTPADRANYFKLTRRDPTPGTWIDLHLSTASTRPPAAMRAELRAALRKVELVQK